MNYFLSALKKYAVFSGRARRSEYWFFVLFEIIFTIVTVILDMFIGIKVTPFNFGLINILFSLAMIVPGISVSVRRLHDIGKSGWMIFINLIPLAGAVWFLVLTLTDSTPGDNEYGPNPKMIIPTITQTSTPVSITNQPTV